MATAPTELPSTKTSAIVWHAVDQGVVLAVPAAALAEAWAQTSPKDYDVLKVLLSLPVVLIGVLLLSAAYRRSNAGKPASETPGRSG